MDFLSRYKRDYDTYGEFSPEEVFRSIRRKQKDIDTRWIDDSGIWRVVSMDSDRYFVFQNSLKCISCGLLGEFFLLQRLKKQGGRCHFNLYANVPGGLMMFTKDHIQPKSRGGKNHLSNYQTMCDQCNYNKGNKDA